MKSLGRSARRRFLTALMAICLIAGTLPTTAINAFAANGTDDPYAYNLKQDQLVEAIEAAVDGEDLVYEQLDFSGENAGEYYDLFYPDGTLYELSLSAMGLEGSGVGTSDLSLRAFVRVAEEVTEDASYEVDGSEKVLFLLQNNTSDVVTAKIYIDGKESHRLDVYPAEDIIPTDDVADAEVAEAEDGTSYEVQTIDIEPAYTEPEAYAAQEYVNNDVQDDEYLQDEGGAAYEEEGNASDAEADEQIEPDPEEEIVSNDAAIEDNNIEESEGSEEPDEENEKTVLPPEAEISADKLLSGTIYGSVCVGGNGALAFETSLTIEKEDEPENGISTLNAQAGDIAVLSAEDGQVIDGYGKFTATDQQSKEEYTVTIKDVPTNTSISLNYSGIEITNEAGEPVGGAIKGRLFYVPDDASNTDDWEEVSYLKLDGSQVTDTETTEGDDGSTTTITYYAVVPYDAAGEEFDLTTGSLWLKNITLVNAKAEIMPLQTNTLCAMEGDEYTQTLVGAKEMSGNPQTFYYPGYEDDYVELSRLTNGTDYKFYYGTLGSAGDDGYKDTSNLKECEYGQIVQSTTTNDAGETIYEYDIYPLDENYNVVKNTNLYMEYDQVYSFDVVINSIVNEHTEDNGDVYLWKGNEYYVDQYKNQGYDYVPGYTRSQNTLTNCGIWVQLARIREPLINGGSKAFSDYANVSYQDMLNEGVDLDGYDAQNAKDTAEANAPYGIVGPYSVGDASAITQTTKRVTGHIGDELIASDAFGANIVYIVPEDRAEEVYHEDWIDLGAHASDNGYRSWFYWINDYYLLNDNEDELEYVEIVERDDGEIHLEADEMGTSGKGEDYDVWNVDLYTKRESVVKTDMVTNQEELKANNVGFDERIDQMNHIQLRKPGTVEIINEEDGEIYHGELSILFDDIEAADTKAPYVSYSIEVYDPDDASQIITISDSSYMKEENDQESVQLKFKDSEGNDAFYSVVDRFDPEKTQIYVVINFTGTLESESGNTIEFTEDEPFTYSGYLTAAQLEEAYDTCPVYNGYDVAINISDAVQKYINTDTQIILYKVWDDNLNAYDSRGDVDGVVITLERSKDGTTWETVMDDMEDPDSGAKEFTILPPLLDEETGERDLNASQWSLVLTSEDLDLTYSEGDDEGYYEFRIATEAFADGEETSEDFTYNTIITGTSVTNTLLVDTRDITGQKYWEDAEGEPLADIPVNDVIITLYQDGHYFGRQTVTASDGWAFEFKDLPIWNGTEEYEYTLGEMIGDGTAVEDGQSVLLNNRWFHIEITENDDGTYTFVNVENPPQEKDVDADGDGEYGDTGMGVQVGDTVTYKIDYTNYYAQEAKVVITDVVDEGLDFVEASDGGVYDEETRTVTWTFDSVEAKGTGSVTFSAVVNETALVRNEIDNTAEVQVKDDPAVETETMYNPVPDKNVDADGDEVYDDSGMEVHVGGTVVYKIDYENPDDEAATVTITDEVDKGLDFVSATDNGSYEDSSRTITWVIEDVDPHTNGSVYFTATVNEDALIDHIVYNTAVVQVGNHAEQQTKTVENPLGEEEKDVDADGDGSYGDTGKGVQVGDTLTYMITYYNADEENPVTVTITDVLDEGLDFDAASDGGTYDDSTRTITWDLGEIAAQTGGYVTFTAVVNETALVENVVENTAEIIYGDNPAVETNPVYNPVPDKDVDADGDGEFKDSGMQVQIGDTLVYKIDYENPDDEAATVTITDEVDVGLDFVIASQGGSYNSDERVITWVLPNVPAHTNGSVTFTAIVNENASVKNYVDNTAVVQVGNHAEQQTKTVYNPVPTKDVDADENHIYGDNGEEVYVGETLTYTINYFNGYDVEEEVFITDVLDEGLTYVEASDGGIYDADSHTITWDIEHVEAHTAGAVTFSAIVNGSSLTKNEVDNVATVSIRNYSVQTNEVENPVPDKDVDADGDGTYGDDGMPVNVGDTLTYRIDYHNSDDEAAEVIITDVLDVGLDFVSASDGGTYDESTRTITWTIEDVEGHTTGNVTFQAIVNENALEKNEVENTASVKVGDWPAVDTNTVHNPVTQKDVDIHGDGSYGDSGLKVSVGDELTYKIDYENPDEAPATVTITDVLDEGLDFVSADNGGIYDEESRTITWVIEDVAANTNGNVTFVATANDKALANGEVDNTATVQVGDHPEQQTNTVWNPLWEPEKSVDANGDGDFEDDGVLVNVGDELTYKVTYKNYRDEAADITITDKLDPDVTYVSATDGGLYDAGTHTITWTFTDVEAGYEGDVQFTVVVKEDATNKHYVDNTATVTVGNDSQDTNTVYNPVTEKSVDVNGDGDFSDNGVKVNVGDELTYKIDYANGHNDEATVTITDPLDPNVEFVSATDGGSYDASTHTVTWVISNVAARTEGSVEFTVKVKDSALTVNEVDNTASVQVGNDAAVDTNPIWNPLWEPEKSVDTNGDGNFEDDGVQVKVGDELVYKVTYKNYKDEAATITITDELDSNVEFVSATDGGSYDASTHTITWTLSNVSAGTEGDVQFTVKVLSGATTPGEVVNTASVKVGNDNAMQTNTVRNPVTKDTSEGTGGSNPKDNPSTTNPSTTGNTKTSDVNTMYLWILLMIACAFVVAAGVVWRTRRTGARK